MGGVGDVLVGVDGVAVVGMVWGMEVAADGAMDDETGTEAGAGASEDDGSGGAKDEEATVRVGDPCGTWLA